MRVFGLFFIATMLLSCGSTNLTDSWRNADITTFEPKNILVIGVAQDMVTRQAFELQLTTELNKRAINALQSTVVFEEDFINSEQTEEAIRAQIDKLIDAGYDSILISTLQGVDQNDSYSGKSAKLDYKLRKFVGYYLAYQEAFKDQKYVNQYNVFHLEASLFTLNRAMDKIAIWNGNYDIVDAKNLEEAMQEYAKAVIKSLEKEKLIAK